MFVGIAVCTEVINDWQAFISIKSLNFPPYNEVATQIVSCTLPHNNRITSQLFLLSVSHRSCELMVNLLGVLAETSNEVCVFCCVQM